MLGVLAEVLVLARAVDGVARVRTHGRLGCDPRTGVADGALQRGPGLGGRERRRRVRDEKEDCADEIGGGGLGSERGVCRERDERRTSRHLDENPLACMCATTRRTPSDVALSQHVLAPYSVQNVSPRFRAGGLPARAKSGAPACDTHVFLSAAAAPGTRSAARSAASANQTDVRIARVVAQCRSAHHPAGWIVHSHVWSRLVVRNSSERASLGEPETRASTNFNRCSTSLGLREIPDSVQ